MSFEYTTVMIACQGVRKYSYYNNKSIDYILLIIIIIIIIYWLVLAYHNYSVSTLLYMVLVNMAVDCTHNPPP